MGRIHELFGYCPDLGPLLLSPLKSGPPPQGAGVSLIGGISHGTPPCEVAHLSTLVAYNLSWRSFFLISWDSLLALIAGVAISCSFQMVHSAHQLSHHL